MILKLIHTADGSATFYVPELDEQYHSTNGAFTESEHVFINMGFKYHPSKCPVILEVGFGTGLNALLTAHHAKLSRREVVYIALEKFPLEKELTGKLNYSNYVTEKENMLFQQIHDCEWNIPVQITPFFKLYKMKLDITEPGWEVPGCFDIIYFDAFGPEKQPEMWDIQIFSELYKKLLPGGVLVTYSAKGEVRRRLTAAGFIPEKLPGPPGKKEMLRAIKLK